MLDKEDVLNEDDKILAFLSRILFELSIGKEIEQGDRIKLRQVSVYLGSWDLEENDLDFTK